MTGIPKTERIWLTKTTASGATYVITSKTNNRDWYFLYRIEDGKAVKITKNSNPNVLDSKCIERGA